MGSIMDLDRAPIVVADEEVERIARVCHDANASYCASIGDTSQPIWLAAPDWQRDSARAGVRAILDGRVRNPEDSHLSWSAQKRAEGWVYGPVKDAEAKTHPCLVEYDHLPVAQRRKDYLFLSVVAALAEHIP